MKLLFVGTHPENTGAASHFVALAQAMAEAGHEVGMVTCPNGPIARGLATANVRLHLATFRNVLDLRGYLAVLAAARRLEPDWLVGNFGKEYWPLILLGRVLGVPVALFRHRTPPMKRLSGYLLPRVAGRFFAVSQHARQAYLDRGVPGDRVQVLYNPVNMALCRPDPQRRREILAALDIAEDAIVLGYVGRIQPGKGIFTLLEAATAAMALEPRLHCLWLGDGPSASELRQRIAAHPTAERHHVLGWIRDVHPYYSALSLLAFPSIALETFGRALVEAQAAGVPVLGSNVGGVPETLAAGVTGLLLPPAEVTAWRDGIVAMCDPARRLPMAAAAREFVRQRFGTAVIADAFQRLLEDAPVAERRAHRAAPVPGRTARHLNPGAAPRTASRTSGTRKKRARGRR